jgi:hypothetical protein
MRSPDKVVLLFEGITLLDNDRVQEDLRKHHERESGPVENRCWANDRVQ